MGEKRRIKTDCIFYYDFCDMGATIPCCVLEDNFCHTPPCSTCERYLTLRNASTLSKILKLAEKKTGVGAIFVKEYSFTSVEKALSWHCNTIQQGNCRFCEIKEHFPQHRCQDLNWIFRHQEKIASILDLKTKMVSMTRKGEKSC